jgi:hypothetical protein
VPEAAAHARQSPQAWAKRAPLSPEIPAQSRQARKDQDLYVTPVAGSSPVAPIFVVRVLGDPSWQLRLDLDQRVAIRERDGLGPAVHIQLGKDALDAGGDGLPTDVKLGGDRILCESPVSSWSTRCSR